jgi:hypothetical protein
MGFTICRKQSRARIGISPTVRGKIVELQYQLPLNGLAYLIAGSRLEMHTMKSFISKPLNQRDRRAWCS